MLVSPSKMKVIKMDAFLALLRAGKYEIKELRSL